MPLKIKKSKFLSKFLLFNATTAFVAISAVACGTKTDSNANEGENKKGNPDNPGSGNQGTNPGTNPQNPGNTLTKNELQQKVEKSSLNDLFNIDLSGNKSDVYASNVDVTKDAIAIREPGKLILKLSAKENEIPQFTITNTKVDDANGKITIFMAFGKDADVYKSFTIDGFKKKEEFNFGQTKNVSENDQVNYFINMNQDQQFDYDWNLIKNRYLSADSTLTSNLTSQQKQEIDAKLKKLDMPNYDELRIKGYSIAVNDQGKLKLQLPNIGPRVAANWTDAINNPENNTGVARTITNQQYSDFAKQSYHVSINHFLFTKDENQQNLLTTALTNNIDLRNLINQLKDSDTKTKLLDRWNKSNGNRGVWKLIQDDTEKQLVADYGNEKDNNGNEKDAVIYTNWLKSEYDKIYKKLDETAGLDATVKQKVKDYISKNKPTDFNQLAGYPKKQETEAGTASIIDYEIKEDQSYPTKFYFITNYHVVNGISSLPDFTLGLTRLNNNGSYIGNQLKTIPFDQHFSNFSFDKNSVKVILDGRDFFKFDPTSVATNAQNAKEFLDFAIFEVDIDKLPENLLNGKTKEQFAKDMSNDYVNNTNKVSFPTFDYLSQSGYESVDGPIIKRQIDDHKKKPVSDYNLLYLVGFPATQTKSQGFVDFFLQEGDGQYTNKDLITSAPYSYSLWTNANRSLYGKSSTDLANNPRAQRGGFLSHSNVLSEFKNRKGVFDRFLALPFLSYGDNKPNLFTSKDDGKEYYHSGLSYAIRDFNVGGGASGTGVRTKKNELVALVDSVFFVSRVTIATALRSLGVNYDGAFGDYNTPQYDVIYGGGKDQNNSFKQALEKLYGTNYKTHLFDKGVNSAYSDHAFKDNVNAKS
ncbi:Ig-specific serine endopeptidase MIP [Mycoplasma sp. 6243]|uniref:Ig-specific serine endopeptidase MIP n=1 Tax=Mycoplasma sp. 6243 TaxID=3440865 RepID=UPI003EB8FBA3